MLDNSIVVRIKWNGVSAWHMWSPPFSIENCFPSSWALSTYLSPLKCIWLKHPSLYGTIFDKRTQVQQFNIKLRKSKLPSLKIGTPYFFFSTIRYDFPSLFPFEYLKFQLHDSFVLQILYFSTSTPFWMFFHLEYLTTHIFSVWLVAQVTPLFMKAP